MFGERDRVDALRKRVFEGIIRGIGIFALIIGLLEVYVRGPLSPITLIILSEVPVFFAAYYASKRDNVKLGNALATLGILTVLIACVFAQRKYPESHVVCSVYAFCIPMTMTLIVGRRTGAIFLTLAMVNEAQLIWSQKGGIGGQAIVILVSLLFVGAATSLLVSIFNQERQRAEKLALEKEQKLLNAVKRAEQAAASRLQFLANMSHEVRTPMNGVLGVSRLLLDEPLEKQSREFARIILESGEGLLHILDDILDVSKLDAGAVLIEPRPTQPEPLVQQVTQLMQGKALEKGIELTSHTDNLPRWVEVDGHRVRQVLNNLVGNAIKFTASGGVTITTKYHGGQLYFDVVDTGIGMDEATIERVFKPFEQADVSTARRYGGTGLGLAISQQLCRLMGGDVRCKSVLGVGSIFSASLDAPLRTAPTSRKPGMTTEIFSNLKVLVAEDLAVNQLVIQRLLMKLGIEAQVANNGLEAVEAVENHYFDLVFMDLQMPEMGGIEATKRIRALQGERAATKVVALTASLMPNERELCLESGMIDVLAKPIDFDALQEVLKRSK